MTYPKAIVIAAALISGSFLLSKIAVSQPAAATPQVSVLNIALAQTVDESSAMQERASWVWVMLGNKLYACRIELGQSKPTGGQSTPECTNPAEIN